jgi:hypothetical protein
VTIAGSTLVGVNCYIGSGTRIMNGLRIGDGALVGLGSNVIRNVDPGSSLQATPPKHLSKPWPKKSTDGHQRRKHTGHRWLRSGRFPRPSTSCCVSIHPPHRHPRQPEPRVTANVTEALKTRGSPCCATTSAT